MLLAQPEPAQEPPGCPHRLAVGSGARFYRSAVKRAISASFRRRSSSTSHLLGPFMFPDRLAEVFHHVGSQLSVEVNRGNLATERRMVDEADASSRIATIGIKPAEFDRVRWLRSLSAATMRGSSSGTVNTRPASCSRRSADLQFGRHRGTPLASRGHSACARSTGDAPWVEDMRFLSFSPRLCARGELSETIARRWAGCHSGAHVLRRHQCLRSADSIVPCRDIIGRLR